MASIDTIADRSTGTTIAGKAYFETSTNKFIVYNGSSWIELDSDGTGAVAYQNRWGANFDGSNDYLTVPSSTAFDFGTGEFSIIFWMHITSRTSYGGLVTNDLSNRLKFQGADHIINLRLSDNEKNVITYNPGGTNTSLLNNWHHIAVVRSGTTLKGYVDNVEYGSVTATESFSLNGQQWGKNFNDYVGGLLDEIAVFDYGLSTSELSEIYNSGAPYDIQNSYSGTAPLSFYRCGDDASDTATSGGSIATITDSSGNGNDATQGTASAQPTFSDLTGESIYV